MYETTRFGSPRDALFLVNLLNSVWAFITFEFLWQRERIAEMLLLKVQHGYLDHLVPGIAISGVVSANSLFFLFSFSSRFRSSLDASRTPSD